MTAAERILAVLATEVQSAIILDTDDVRAVCQRVKELEAEMYKRTCLVETWADKCFRYFYRLTRMRKAFRRTGKQLLASRAECMGGAYWPVPEDVLKKPREYGVWHYGSEEQPENGRRVIYGCPDERGWEPYIEDKWNREFRIPRDFVWRYGDNPQTQPPEHVLRRLRGES